MKRGFWIIFFLLACYSASAILITPAILETEYISEGEYTCDFSFKSEKETNFLIYARGELNESISFSENKIKSIPGKWMNVECKMKLPQNLKPGLSKNFVGVVEAPDGKGVIGGKAGVEMILFVRKPYPGKYLEIENFEIDDAEINEPAHFTIKVANRGNERINDAFALIEIYNQDKKTGSIETNHIPIIDEGILEAVWQSDVAGRYDALAKINYDGTLLEEQKKFDISEFLVKILNVSESITKKGDIAKFDITVQSNWNKIIEDAYIKISAVGQEVSSTTEHFSVDPWDVKHIRAFLETESLNEGEYEVEVALNYANKISKTKTKLIITRNFGLFNLVLILGVIVLIWLIVANLIKLKKKWSKKE